LHPKLTPQ
jgi:scytalone dehydratase